jgi:hypothetical protein
MRKVRFQFRIAHLMWAVLVAAVLLRIRLLPLIVLMISVPFVLSGVLSALAIGFIERISAGRSVTLSDQVIAVGGAALVLAGVVVWLLAGC